MTSGEVRPGSVSDVESRGDVQGGQSILSNATLDLF